VDPGRRPLIRRGGFSAVEALVALLLLLLVLQAGWSLTAGIARASFTLAERAESLAAARATGWIVQEELEGARAGADVSSPAGDSIALRAFRGTARVCGRVATRDLAVRWSGLRAPDPAKDSVLVLVATGSWVRRALQARAKAPGACGPQPDPSEERWTLTDSVAGAVLLRVFERGSYHLSDAALRYRIGLGGRQPLTPASFDPARSGITRAGRDRLVLVVATRGSRRGGRGPAWRRTFPLAGGW
jgi:hypothetical protein